MNMGIDVLIDKLTPCLECASTGELMPTSFSLAKDSELKDLQSKGWNFNWSADELKKTNVYKLTLRNDTKIQGLVSAEIGRGVVYVALAESSPHNLGKNKQYKGVGGHLFAIAIKLSLALGFGGYVYFDAKDMDLVRHYAETLGAERVRTKYHDYRMEIAEENAPKILDKYTLEGDLNVT